MANKALFTRVRQPADATNAAGGRAYALSPEHALAQLAATGTLHASFYTTAEAQLDQVREVADRCAPEFVAKAAVWAREQGHMKDLPAALCAMLSKADPALLDLVFERVVDNGRMLRTFVQLVRSGQFGRKSLGSGPRRLVRRWLEGRSDAQVYRAAIGNDPSLADVIKLAHPKPATASRRALYAYLLDKPHEAGDLPALVREVEAWKAGRGQGQVPDVDFRLLTSLPLTKPQWAQVARRGGWQMVRMNLNTFLRHGAFDVPGTAEAVAKKLADAAEVRRAKAFPYQLLAAFLSVEPGVPAVVKDALQAAMEVATENVPAVGGTVYVCPDVSGSMHGAAVTGDRGSASSKVRAIDVAALVAAAFLRKNPGSEVLPFDTQVHAAHGVNPRDTVMTNADKLRRFGGGGTAVSVALAELNRRQAEGALVLYVSDNESWVDSRRAGATDTLREWEAFRRRSPRAKLVCIDVAPGTTAQAPDRDDIVNVGGFSDHVFRLVADVVQGRLGPDRWVGEIAAVSLGPLRATA
ncbi:MAG: RNA-binding protein [Planctomycetota bacterium]|nr:RNA-binding protein [Planctomycetota bacterium]